MVIMPAFGLILIILGIVILVNTFNGNIYNLTQGTIGFNFTGSGSSANSTSNTPVVPNIPNKPNA